MGMADEMRGLVQEIQASHEARGDRVAAIRQETAEMLKGFRRHLGVMAAELRTFLGHAESSRMEAFRAMFQEIQARQKARKHEVHGFLAGIRHEMGAMAAHWRTLPSTMARKRTGAR